ncbi:hypothetical protein FOPG_18614 [Fusarium oxysporum f. sp. conglutinans race 2 54008]|nr:hypothetical protein FOXG_14168 [Fusarium oxysporum f. sp. lycopersici 4287]EXL65148.1 hypothetical protein FOPG_18614 [Fusarium oxysporum f. sp. conglutinans race 2 54008]KAI8416365.1 hypothetical protein FOFC_02674 [Fusarium oxysporum]KNB15768.1 hypothetical protein FOXG_14168 [Fusarium oxysporum f. sp. lycopersici 4287]
MSTQPVTHTGLFFDSLQNALLSMYTWVHFLQTYLMGSDR